MKVGFIELLAFTPKVDTHFGGDDHYRRLQMALDENPEGGDVIPGCGGVRKVRWPDPRRGKGKRGGLRVLYIYVPQISTVLFLDVYDKNKSEDLTPSQKRILATIAQRIRGDYV